MTYDMHIAHLRRYELARMSHMPSVAMPTALLSFESFINSCYELFARFSCASHISQASSLCLETAYLFTFSKSSSDPLPSRSCFYHTIAVGLNADAYSYAIKWKISNTPSARSFASLHHCGISLPLYFRFLFSAPFFG